MAGQRTKDAVRAIVVGGVWLVLLWVGFLAKDYQDDIVLSAYVIAGATGLAALIGWLVMGY